MLTEDEEDFLRASVTVDRLDLQREFAEVASQLAFWVERFADAQRDTAEAKYALETVEARLSLRHREGLRADLAAKVLTAPRGITQDMVRERVVLDPGYSGARLGLIEAESREARLKGAVQAVATKRDMLVSLGAHVRAEMGLDPVVRAQIATHVAATSRKSAQ